MLREAESRTAKARSEIQYTWSNGSPLDHYMEDVEKQLPVQTEALQTRAVMKQAPNQSSAIWSRQPGTEAHSTWTEVLTLRLMPGADSIIRHNASLELGNLSGVRLSFFMHADTHLDQA